MPTREPLPWERTNAVMIRNNFDWAQRRASHIWAARDRHCPVCKAPPYHPCRNLADLKKMEFDEARTNKHPHTERIDYVKLATALHERGYR